MPTAENQVFDALVRRLSTRYTLGVDDEVAIRALPMRIKSIRPGATIIRKGEKILECCVLLSGYVCRSKLTNGRRQIVAFLYPGDILDVQHLLLATSDHNLQAITRSEIACFPITNLQAIISHHPNIAKALWRESLIEASIFREWVLNVGRRPGASRVAHLLCEFVVRLDAAGLGRSEPLDFPMTQEHIGDATGLTAVHVNRMLRILEQEGVLLRGGKSISITDWLRMKRIADFDPLYLHMAA